MQKLTRIAMDRFLAAHATNEPVLEIGVPGGGGYARFFPKHTTLDIDPARKPDVVGDIYRLPFADASWDTVVMIEVLEHLTDPAAAIEEVKRVLRPGGTLILTTRFLGPMHDIPHDYFRFTYYGLKHLFREWQDVEVRADLTTMETLGTFFQRLAYQTRVRGGKLTKAAFIFCAWGCSKLNWLIKEEYGNITRTVPLEGGVLASGYYVVARRQG